MTTWQPCLLQGDKIMGEIVEYDFIILPLDFYVFLWKYRDSTRTRWNSQVGNIVEIIYPSPPLFFWLQNIEWLHFQIFPMVLLWHEIKHHSMFQNGVGKGKQTSRT